MSINAWISAIQTNWLYVVLTAAFVRCRVFQNNVIVAHILWYYIIYNSVLSFTIGEGPLPENLPPYTKNSNFSSFLLGELVEYYTEEFSYNFMNAQCWEHYTVIIIILFFVLHNITQHIIYCTLGIGKMTENILTWMVCFSRHAIDIV